MPGGGGPTAGGAGIDDQVRRLRTRATHDRSCWRGSATPSPTGRPAVRSRATTNACCRPGRIVSSCSSSASATTARPSTGRHAVDLPATIAIVLAAHRATRIVVPAGIPTRGSPDRARNLSPTTRPLACGARRLDGVLTGCAVAIAETGTIVLDAGPDQGRRALSLLPDLHVCVVRGRPGRRLRPGGHRAPRPDPPADVDQRAVRDERHRAAARRGRPRPTPPRGHRRRGLIGRDRWLPAPLACHRPATRCVLPSMMASNPRAHVALNSV